MIKRLFVSMMATAFVATFFGAALAGCNTIEGAGKDIEKGGQEIKQEAKENKKY